jgi:hypothetical protein
MRCSQPLATLRSSFRWTTTFCLQSRALSPAVADLVLVRRMSMRPGQLEPNEFETAPLKRFATQDPSLSIDSLHVLSLEFTGVGSFTSSFVAARVRLSGIAT